MNYKLAKQLKDAGFPQDLELGSKVYTGLLAHPRKDIPPQYPLDVVLNPEAYKKIGCIKNPTLSELIEACGKLTDNRLEFHRSNTKKYWYAIVKNNQNQSIVEIQGTGKTLKEAVSKLWLKLNEKRNKKMGN